jgi:NAD(P)-dependent dehydrogenase (short-subunit alcohol dehydrogenase family)
MPHRPLKNKNILITGAGSGIGAALSLACAQRGATVILMGHTLAKTQIVYDLILEKGYPQPLLAPLDFFQAGPEALHTLQNTLKDHIPQLDGCVHNATLIGTRTPLSHYTPDLWLRVMQITINMPFLLSQYLLPLLIKSTHPRMLFSIGALPKAPQAYWGAFGCAKAALDHFAQMLAIECQQYPNMGVYRLDPGPTHTVLRTTAFPAEDRSLLKEPHEVLEPYLHLLSDNHQEPSGSFFSSQKHSPSAIPF